MVRLSASVYKEFLILIRDRAGLAILFLMPMVLILIMSLIQDAPFRDFQEMKIPLLLVDNDQDSLGVAIQHGLQHSRVFTVSQEINGKKPTAEEAHRAVRSGDFKIGIIIPKGATRLMNERVRAIVEKTLSGLEGEEETTENPESAGADSLTVMVYFDPVTKESFKASILSSLEKFTSKIETQTIVNTFADKLAEITGQRAEIDMGSRAFLHFEEVMTADHQGKIASNSVQHNVPAWTMFAMFFIVLPLAENIIKEREEGSALRLKLMPGSYFPVLAGKLLLYVGVCVIQFILMLLVGIFILPLFDLPVFQTGDSIAAIIMVVLSSAIAATGFGLMVGTIFKTHQQAATFGSVAVIILAALGGIWVPSYVMPEMMRAVGSLSPLGWGLDAFNNIFLRGGNALAVLPESALLLLFGGLTLLVAFIYSRIHRQK